MLLPTLVLPLALLLAPAPQGKTDPQPKHTELTEKEAAALKQQRDLADAYMRKLLERAVKTLEKAPKADKVGRIQEEKDRIAMETLKQRLEEKRYFGTGTGPAELKAFKTQVLEADRLAIQVNDQALKELLRGAVLLQVDEKGLKEVEDEVRKQQGGATPEAVARALRDEFRARIVRDLLAKKK